MGYVYSGSVHTRDHGHYVLLLLWNLPQGKMGVKGLIICPENGYNNRGGSTPCGTPKGPQDEPKF